MQSVLARKHYPFVLVSQYCNLQQDRPEECSRSTAQCLKAKAPGNTTTCERATEAGNGSGADRLFSENLLSPIRRVTSLRVPRLGGKVPLGDP